MLILEAAERRAQLRHNVFPLLTVYLESRGPSVLTLKLLPALLTFKHSAGELGGKPVPININL